MIAGLSSIIERVTGLFGKTYFLAGFFPVLFLAAVSVLGGYDTCAWVYRQVNAFRAADAGRQALASGVLLTGVAMVGFVYWSAGPWWRALLQGNVLPQKERERLTQRQRARLAELEGVVEACERRVFAFRTGYPDPKPEPDPQPEPDPEPQPEPAPEPVKAVPARRARRRLLERFLSVLLAPRSVPPAETEAEEPETPTWMERLLAARLKGDARKGPPVEPSRGLAAAFGEVRALIRGLEPVEAGQLEALCVRLEVELAAAPVPADSALDELHVEFERLAATARARAESAWSGALSERRIRFPVNLATVGPTRMANVAELYRDYALTRYRMDPEVFWLHLQRSAAADDRFRPILEEARLKLDVSVAMAMACALGSLWAIAIAMWGHSLPLFLLTGVGLPLGAFLFRRATVGNLRVYGEAVRATVDLFRFDVLKALHIPLPPDPEAERRLWEKLTLGNQLLGEGKLPYAHAEP